MKRKKIKLTRLLTLVCFFHFSGLNNGFTYFLAESSGARSSGGTNFATVAIGKCASAINPLNWNINSCRKIFRPFTRSGKMIEVASQRTVQNMLTRSGFFQICLNLTIKDRCNTRPGANLTVKNPVSASSDKTLREEIISQIEESYSFGKNTDLNSDKKELWLKLEQFQCKVRDKYKYGDVPKFLMSGKWRDEKRLDLHCRSAGKKFVKFCRVITRPGALFASEKSEDDPYSVSGSAAEALL